MQPMRVLIVTKRQYMSHDLIDDRFGRNFHLSSGLVGMGHEIVIHAADYEAHAEGSQDLSGVTVISKRLGVASTVSYLMSVLRAGRSFRPDVVLANGDVHFGLIAWLLTVVLRSSFVYDLYDNYESFDSARFPGVVALHRFLCRRADLVLVVSKALADRIAPLARQVATIGNGVDTSVFRPHDKEQSRLEVGIDSGGPVVCYIGGITDTRGVTELIHAVARIRDEGSPTVLLLVGPDLSTLDLTADWIDYRDPVAQSEVAAYVTASDVAVLPYLDDEWGRYTHPQKLGEYIACGVPIVATALDGYRHLEGLEQVFWVTPGDEHSMAAGLLHQINEPRLGVLPESMTWTSIARKLGRVLGQVVERKRHPA